MVRGIWGLLGLRTSDLKDILKIPERISIYIPTDAELKNKIKGILEFFWWMFKCKIHENGLML